MMKSQKVKKEKEKMLSKILDVSSSVQSRVKALKTCLETLLADEMKRYLVENNYAYFYVWYDFYTGHVDPAIKSSSNRTLSKDVKDDLDTLLFVIEKLIHLMPEKLASGWHCNSISAFLKRLLTLECCTKYRYVGIRVFLSWFQIVRCKAPADMVFLFSTLVPGLDQTKLTPTESASQSRASIVSGPQLQNHLVSVSPVNGFSSRDVEPLVPATQAELSQQTLDLEPMRVMENILSHLIANITATCWSDARGRVEAFEFMLNQFRQKYLFKIFQDYNHKMDLYSDNKVCEPEECVNEERDLVVKMKVLVIHWIMKIIPPSAKPKESDSTHTGTTGYSSSGSSRTLPNPLLSGFGASGDGLGSGYPFLVSGGEACQVAYQVLTSSKDNINMCLEILRQGLLLPLKHHEVTHAVIQLLTSWLDLPEEERPIFVQTKQLEEMNEELAKTDPSLQLRERLKLADRHNKNFSESLNESKLASMGVRAAGSKSGRCISMVNETPPLSQDSLRVGLQNYLQYLFRALSVVFYIQHKVATSSGAESSAQNETRSKVVQVFRKVAVIQSGSSSSSSDGGGSNSTQHPLIETPVTWKHAIHTLSHATKYLFDHNRHVVKNNQSFLSNLVNTLIVNCVMSNLFVRMESEIWDDLTSLLSSIVHKSPIVVEQWAKTMKFLTIKILSPTVYQIDYSAIEELKSSSGESKRVPKISTITVQSSTRQSVGPLSSKSPISTNPTNDTTLMNQQSNPATVQTKKLRNPNGEPNATSNFAESFTTQALTSMLRNSNGSGARPTSLYLSSDSGKKKPLRSSNNHTRKSGAFGSALSKSETCLYSPSGDDSFTDTIDEGGRTRTSWKSERVKKRSEKERGSTSKLDYVATSDSSDTDANNPFDVSINNESLHTDLIMRGNDGSEMDSVSNWSHDTQMSWMHTHATTNEPPQQDIKTAPKPHHFNSPSRSRAPSSSSYSSEIQRRVAKGDSKPQRPRSVVETIGPVGGLDTTPVVDSTLKPEWSARSSWSGEKRRLTESSSVRFADVSNTSGIFPDDSDVESSVFNADNTSPRGIPVCENGTLVPSEAADCGVTEEYIGEQGYEEEDEGEETRETDSNETSQNSEVGSWTQTVDNRSLLTGGSVTGWTRESAFILWRRILGIIGDVNEISDDDTCCSVFKHLIELHDILQNIAKNQRFVDEATGQFFLPTHVPPVPILLPWAIGRCRVGPKLDSDDDRVGDVKISNASLLAHKLASKIILEYPALDKGIITSFYQIVYENLKLGCEEVNELFVKELFKIYSCKLPGSMVLLKVLVCNACEVIETFFNQSSTVSKKGSSCIEEAIMFLGSLTCFPDHFTDWKCLHIDAQEVKKGQTVTSVYRMSQLVQFLFNGVLCSIRNPNMQLPAACRSASVLCIAAVSVASVSANLGDNKKPPSFRYEECLKELFSHLKFSRLTSEDSNMRFLTSSEFVMAQMCAHFILTVFDVLLDAEASAEVLHEIISSLVSSLLSLVTCYQPEQKMQKLAVSLLLAIADSACKLPIEILTYCEPDEKVPDTNRALPLPMLIHKGLTGVQTQCKKWLSHVSSCDSESVQDSSEHSVDHESSTNTTTSGSTAQPPVSVSVSVTSQGQRGVVTSSSSSTPMSSSLLHKQSNSSGGSPVAREYTEVAEQILQATELVSNIILSLLGQYPTAESGVCKLDSSVTEADCNPASAQSNGSPPDMTFALVDNNYSQIFVYNDSTIISVLELPQQVSGDGDTENERLSGHLVRFIIRDLSGKYCYDFFPLQSYPNEDGLERSANEDDQIDSLLGTRENTCETVCASDNVEVPELLEDCLQSERPAQSASFLPVENEATSDQDEEKTEHGEAQSVDKYDILDYMDGSVEDPSRIPNALNEVLAFLSTSPELLDFPGQRLDAPRPPKGYVERHHEEIKEMERAMLEQETKENAIGENWDTLETQSLPESNIPDSETGPFESSARLLMQLNCFSWNNRKLLFLLNKCPALVKELKHLDTQTLRQAHKFAVIYIANGQETKSAILSNTRGSNEYEAFLSGLGWEVEVESHKGYLGLLPSNGSLGKNTLYYASPTCEVAYHIVTRMLGSDDQKWRHVGNDHVHVVWNDHCRPFQRSVLPTQFADVLIVLSPLPNRLISVQMSCKPPVESHLLGPLFDGAIIDLAILPVLVRSTAIRASNILRQIKNGSAPLFFASRQQTIQSIVKRFKMMQTFEEFVFQSVNPTQSRGTAASQSSKTLQEVLTTSADQSSKENSTRSGLDNLLSNSRFDLLKVKPNNNPPQTATHTSSLLAATLPCAALRHYPHQSPAYTPTDSAPQSAGFLVPWMSKTHSGIPSVDRRDVEMPGNVRNKTGGSSFSSNSPWISSSDCNSLCSSSEDNSNSHSPMSC